MWILRKHYGKFLFNQEIDLTFRVSSTQTPDQRRGKNYVADGAKADDQEFKAAQFEMNL